MHIRGSVGKLRVRYEFEFCFSLLSLQGTLAEHIAFGKMGFFEITLNDVLALPFRGIFVATLGMVRTLSCLLDSCHHLPYTTSKVAPSSCESFFTVH